MQRIKISNDELVVLKLASSLVIYISQGGEPVRNIE